MKTKVDSMRSTSHCASNDQYVEALRLIIASQARLGRRKRPIAQSPPQAAERSKKRACASNTNQNIQSAADDLAVFRSELAKNYLNVNFSNFMEHHTQQAERQGACCESLNDSAHTDQEVSSVGSTSSSSTIVSQSTSGSVRNTSATALHKNDKHCEESLCDKAKPQP